MSQATDLAVLISRMQKNADQVEKNILRSEELLALDTERDGKNLPLIHQKVNADNLAEAEGLLKDLFMDVDKSKKLQHPQAAEIEGDVRNLHDRWVNDCATYRELYGQVQDLDLTPKIDWGPLLDEKMKQLNSGSYGPSRPDVEKQIAAHNILHQAIEAYSTQLNPSSTTSQEQYAAFKEKYAKLLESSKQRRAHLASLYEYMQSCSKELVYLSGQQDRILQRDWSDRMVDPPGVRMEYEKFKNNALLAHENEINQLQAEGDRLVQMKHPGSPTIKAHRDALQAEWQAFLNLCLAQEIHLDNVEEYKKFQLDAETLSESLERLNSSLDPKSLGNKSNPEVLLTLKGDEPAVMRNEQRLAALRELSSNVVPLKLRRIKPTKPTTAVSLCDWRDEEDTVRRGEKLNLKSNSDNNNWELQGSNGKIRTLPGACFMVPPPDAEALEKVNSLDRALMDLKSRRSALMASLKNPAVEMDHPQKAATEKSIPENPRTTELASEIDKLNRDLDQSQKEILSRLRTPLDNRNPTQDLANRLQDHEKCAQTVRKLESKKAAVQREMEPILAKKPLGPIASTLPPKLSATNNKIDDINTLIDLYNKKATASMFLEKQAQNVDGMVSGFEQQLAKDGNILDQPNALPGRNQQLQVVRMEVASKKDELNKLSKDLDLTEQACSSLQRSFNEYCPDIRRQENVVKQLKNRYTNINNQLQEKVALTQEAINKKKDFENAVQSLDFFLVNLPNNTIKPTDDVAQITAKQNSQKKVMEDIKRKSGDLDNLKFLSRDLQSILNEYEVKSNTYRGTLNDDGDDGDDDYDEPILKKRQISMAQSIQTKEKDLLNRFSEASAENDQLLKQLGIAKNIKAQNEEKISQVVVNQQLQLQSQKKDLEESDSLKNELSEEVERRLHAEKELETYRKRFVSLRSRRGVERLEEKEVVEYYRDPKVEVELQSLKTRIQDEALKRSRTHSELEMINDKILKLEIQLSRIEPQMVTKVLTEYERDPQLDKEAARIREEMQAIRLELQTRETEAVHVKTELTLLSQQKPKIRETVVKKEVVRLEKDPKMLKAVLTFQNDIAEEESRCKSLNDNIFRTRSQINTLERVIPTIEPKIVTKVVKQVQQDPEMLEESRKLRMALEEENNENAILMKDLTTLQLRYGEVDKLRAKVEVKEILNEIYRVDPETEVMLVRLRKELQDLSRNRADLEKEITTVIENLTTLRAQKPQVEYKEVTQEVIKEEKSPEVIRELQRLNNQVSRLQVNYDTTLELLTRLRKERDELKAEKSKVETKLVNKEVIKYEDDPLLEKEADRLRRNVREEIQQRRSVEENLFDLQNQYIVLERQKPEEKIVMQEVVRLQKDPKQILEHEKLNKTLDDELKARRKLELEVRQLRALVQEKEKALAQMDERQKKIKVESELRQIKSRILELENAPPPVEEKIVIEEVLKVERDPKLEKLSDDIRVELETEGTNINRLEREIRNLKIKLEILQKEKSVEKVVYREVVRVEKDPAVEAEREHLRELVTQERNLRRNQEDDIQNINIKMTHLQTSKSVTSQEETAVIANRDALQREKEDLFKQLKMLESQRQSISITFQQQSKLMSERNQMARQRSLKSSSQVQQLEKEILNEKDKIHQRDTLITELQTSIKKEDQAETHTRETNLSTKITIMDPETGKDMSPYDAYLQGLIDRSQYIHLSELECDWEEITSTGPEGDVTILQDRKSGKQYSVKDALREGRLTQHDVSRYKEGKMHISEFALLVIGETRKPYIPQVTAPRSPTKPAPTSSLNSMPSSLRSSYTSLNTQQSGGLNSMPSTLRSSYTSLNTQQSGGLNSMPSTLRSSYTSLNTQQSGGLNSMPSTLRSSYTSLNTQQSGGLNSMPSTLRSSYTSLNTQQSGGLNSMPSTLRSSYTSLNTQQSGGLNSMPSTLRSSYTSLNTQQSGGLNSMPSTLRSSYTSLNTQQSGGLNSMPSTLRSSYTSLNTQQSGGLNSMPSTLRSSYTSLNTQQSGGLNSMPSTLRSSYTSLNTQQSGGLNSMPSSLRSSYTSLNTHSSSSNNLSPSAGDEYFPISGIFDTTTESRMSVRSALTRKLIDADTALKLLEAQAASGGIVDLAKKDKLSVHKAAEHGLIDTGHMYKLLNAQKAFTGVEDPVTKERLAVGQAAQKGYIPQENARRYMEAQHLTGGLVDPSKAGRLTVQEALAKNLIDSTTAKELQDEASFTKELVDPITKEKISYKQAMDLCKKDISTGLLLLPAASTDAANAPSYSNYRFSSSYSKV
ncbi:envoplakin isoform X2 [Micropterus dolomieu]|uniref:envoplakin isoform X2 n=1 Tax=Micropterus dolomieu TaxID=147949 RepID=UPI001E8D61F7|nr:envoplakin isoform X2 [Micropterus dolomieu]